MPQANSWAPGAGGRELDGGRPAGGEEAPDAEIRNDYFLGAAGTVSPVKLETHAPSGAHPHDGRRVAVVHLDPRALGTTGPVAATAGAPARKKYQLTQTIAASPAAVTSSSRRLMRRWRGSPRPSPRSRWPRINHRLVIAERRATDLDRLRLDARAARSSARFTAFRQCPQLIPSICECDGLHVVPFHHYCARSRCCRSAPAK